MGILILALSDTSSGTILSQRELRQDEESSSFSLGSDSDLPDLIPGQLPLHYDGQSQQSIDTYGSQETEGDASDAASTESAYTPRPQKGYETSVSRPQPRQQGYQDDFRYIPPSERINRHRVDDDMIVSKAKHISTQTAGSDTEEDMMRELQPLTPFRDEMERIRVSPTHHIKMTRAQCQLTLLC